MARGAHELGGLLKRVFDIDVDHSNEVSTAMLGDGAQVRAQTGSRPSAERVT
jgi:hypothetical protein